MLWYCLYVLASVTSEIIPSRRSLAFRTSTAQKTNGEYIVRAFGSTSRASPLLGVCDPEGSGFRNIYKKRTWGFFLRKEFGNTDYMH